MRDYLFVAERNTAEIVINRSRFIATVTPIADASEADGFIKEIAKKYSDATHNCYAYIANAEGTEMRFSDDGEPQGTAGQPMLEVLRKRGLMCTAVVVTRYFGGVKLGANGLVAAYTKSVVEALNNAFIQQNRYSKICTVKCTYQHFNLLEKWFKVQDIAIIDTQFADGVTLEIAVPQAGADSFGAKLTDLTSGGADIAIKEEKYFNYNII